MRDTNYPPSLPDIATMAATAASTAREAAGQERQTEAWAICLSTRMLSTLMNASDVCALSTCSHAYIPFRRQIALVEVTYLAPALFSQMVAGTFMELQSLKVTPSFLFFDGYKQYQGAVAVAFQHQHLPKLEHLWLGTQVYSALYCILERGLGVQGKRQLKSLTLTVGREEWTEEIRKKHAKYSSPFLKGYPSLESLTCLTGFSWSALSNGNFPRLQKLTLKEFINQPDLH